MAGIQGQITIARPVEVVFDYVSDETNEPKYNPSMVRAEKTSAGPIGSGTTFTAAVRTGGRLAEMTIQFTAYERPGLLESRTTMKQAEFDYTLRFEPVPEGTLMRWSATVRTKGALRLLGPIVTWLGARQEQRIWRDLKRHLEAGPAGLA